MAEAIIISALLPLVFEKSANLIEGQLGIVLGADVEKELGKLKSTLSTIQAVLEDAEERQVTEKALMLWLSNLKDTAYLTDDLLEDLNLDVLEGKKEAREHHFILAKLISFFSCSRNPILSAPRTCRKVKDIVERFDQLAEERAKFHLKEGRAPLGLAWDSRAPTQSYVPELEVIGRKEDVDIIVDTLIRQEHEKKVAVLPIVGMGGLGKTTLVQMVYNNPRINDHFELCMWISVMTLDNFSAAKIGKTMIEIATNTGFSLSNLESIQQNLRKLIGPKRYLLVLDDVWTEDPQAWEELRNLLQFGAEGSAVVVTTRSGVVSAIMGTLPPHQLGHLSEADCWILFSRKAFEGREQEAHPTLVEIGRDIVRKCGMLPQAVKALGGMMHGKGDEEREWRAVLESKIWDLPLGKSGIKPALLLSYYHLPSHLKQCLAFCALFPRDWDIQKEALIKLWMANGFIQTTTTTSDTELQGQQIFQDLQKRSFFQSIKEVGRWYDGKKVTVCRMHDLIHDLVRSVSGNECLILDKWDEVSTSNCRPRHLFVNCEGGDNPAAPSTTLRTLLYKRGKLSEVMFTTWTGAKYLRALDLHDTGLMEFPISICDLRHLWYLNLSRNDIQELPEGISRLFSLQTLDLSACGSLVKLPKSLSEMSSLMFLYLEGCCKLRSMPIGLKKLSRLQTLTRYVATEGDVESGGIGELKDFNLHGMLELYNLKNVTNVADAYEANIGSKRNLQQLDLDWGDESDDDVESAAEIDERVLEAIQPHSNLKQLRIRHYRGIRYPMWLTAGNTLTFLSNLVEIVLAGCSRCEHLPQLWQLPKLEVLEVGGMEPVKQIGGKEFYGSNGRDVFPSLRRLKLYGMPNLEEWSGVGEERPCFPTLAEMEIIDCPVLRIVPVIPSVRSLLLQKCPLLRPDDGFFGRLMSLERLEIDSCDQMVLMLEQDDEPGGPLVFLEIKNCDELMFSSSSLGMWKHFKSLQTLHFRTCDGIEILPLDLFQGLSSLKRLSIHCCDSMMGSFRDDEEGLSFQGLNALEDLDVQVCTEFPCFHPEGLKHLAALKKLSIYSNHGLSELPDFPDSVREVVFYNNWNLLSLPKGLGHLPSLESLVLLNMNRITWFSDEVQDYKALKSLKIEDCRQITELPLGLQQRLPSLNYLEIKQCPVLERQCRLGGDYCKLVSRIPIKYIGDS